MKQMFLFLLTIFMLSQSLVVYAINDEEDLSKKIEINQSQLVLSSKLKKEYVGYRYDIVNNSNQDINIVSAQLINGVNGSVAAQSVDNGSGVGTTWIICGPLGFITFGTAWVAGILATPIVWYVAKTGNKRARRESKAYPNLINLGHLAKGESTSVQTLVPIGALPQLKLTVQGQYSKELIMVSR